MLNWGKNQKKKILELRYPLDRLKSFVVRIYRRVQPIEHEILVYLRGCQKKD